ncbi:MAG: DUF2914 domain-containing protein [Oligoflexia bacterium]|nr:DUF2914 domain-containing protein [Oligoflexia bacterium]
MVVSKFRELYRKYERWVPIAFFILGFVFDAVMLRHVDELKTLIQQAAYLLFSAALIGVELVESVHEIHPPSLPGLGRLWKYREAFLHFFLGTLLNSYTIFYFKSSSAFVSFLFIGILIALLTLNEFKRFGESQTQVHIAFLSLCLISYLVSLVPIIVGFIGVTTYLMALAATVLVFGGYYRLLKPKLGTKPSLCKTHLLAPFGAVQGAFALLYFAHAIPPVPLSISYMGIYHDIKKANGTYQLSATRPRWRFWEHGDQTFLARPGDTVFCFVRVFSPARFKDQLQVRWLSWDRKRGWISSDAIPFSIEGGRENGYRGITLKKNYQPGEWRVQIETADAREVGRINFTIETDESTDVRDVVTTEQ